MFQFDAFLHVVCFVLVQTYPKSLLQDGSLWGHEGLQSSRGWSHKGKAEPLWVLFRTWELLHTSGVATVQNACCKRFDALVSGRALTSLGDRRSRTGRPTASTRTRPRAEGRIIVAPDACDWSAGSLRKRWAMFVFHCFFCLISLWLPIPFHEITWEGKSSQKYKPDHRVRVTILPTNRKTLNQLAEYVEEVLSQTCS